MENNYRLWWGALLCGGAMLLPTIVRALPLVSVQFAETPPQPVAPPAEQPPMAPIPSDGVALRARFGEPDFIRRETDSELWRYDSGKCAVFFFLSRAGNTLQLRYVDTLPRDVQMQPDAACVNALQQAAKTPPAELPPKSISP